MDFKLNEKMKLFVLGYTGCTATAMQQAGYTGTRAELEKKGNELLKTPAIAEAIRERSRYLASSVRMIAQTEEIQGFWSDVMRNNDPYHINEVDNNGVTIPKTNIPLANRLKSSEYLAKSQNMFVERIDVRSQVSFVEIIQDAYSISDSELERIEQQYEHNRQRKIDAKLKQAEAKTFDVEAMEVNEEPLDDLF